MYDSAAADAFIQLISSVLEIIYPLVNSNYIAKQAFP